MSTDDRGVRPRLLHEWFLEDLGPNGYVAGPPPWGNRNNEWIDREIAEAAACEACGARDCFWWPVHNAAERSYRAFIRCRACGNLAEF